MKGYDLLALHGTRLTPLAIPVGALCRTRTLSIDSLAKLRNLKEVHFGPQPEPVKDK